MPNSIARATAAGKPNPVQAIKTTAVAENVLPSASEITLPDIVMKVIATATHPTKDIVDIIDIRLSRLKKPGVTKAKPNSNTMKTIRLPVTRRLGLRRPCCRGAANRRAKIKGICSLDVPSLIARPRADD